MGFLFYVLSNLTLNRLLHIKVCKFKAATASFYFDGT